MDTALLSARPMLESKDLDATLKFYTEHLGFELSGSWEDEGKLQWISLRNNTTEMMFSVPNIHSSSSEPILTGSIYCNAFNIDSLWENIKDKCDIVYPIENFEYGMREFAIKDNNGYILNFGKPIEPETDFDRFFSPGFSLETKRILLRPLLETDEHEMLGITQSDFLWNYFIKELNDKNQLHAWINDALHDRINGKRVPFSIVEKETGNICGSTSYMNILFFDKKLEIGASWLGEKYLGSGINRHCKFALLQYAFEVMEFERVEIKTDHLNERAKAALRKIGCVEEGIFRNHMQMPHNRRRSSVYFSILKSEWPAVKSKYFTEVIE